MASSQFIKIIVALLYMIKYKMSNCLCCGSEQPPSLIENSKMQDFMDGYKVEILGEIKANL
jgi:hypothetical protein